MHQQLNQRVLTACGVQTLQQARAQAAEEAPAEAAAAAEASTSGADTPVKSLKKAQEAAAAEAASGQVCCCSCGFSACNLQAAGRFYHALHSPSMILRQVSDYLGTLS